MRAEKAVQFAISNLQSPISNSPSPPWRADPAAQGDAADAVHARPTDGALPYEPALAEGEIREEWAGDTLTVRVGAPSPRRALMRHWPSFLAMAWWLALLAMLAHTWWRLSALRVRPGRGLGVLSMSLQMAPWAFALLALLLLWDVYKVFRAARWARGVIVISANRQGLSWRNLPAWRHEGQIAPGDIDVLLVKPLLQGMKMVYGVEVRPRGAAGRGRLLLSGKSQDAMERVRTALARALGIESPEAVLQRADSDEPATARLPDARA